jgi:hypothetical protein
MRTPPLMQRTLGDDLKVATAIMLGASIACLLLHAEWTLLAYGFVALAVATAALNLVRHVRSRRKS